MSGEEEKPRTFEHLHVQQLIPQPAVERLDVAVLPGAASSMRLHSHPLKPIPDHPRRQRWPILETVQSID